MANQASIFVKNESTKGTIRITHYQYTGSRKQGTPRDITNDGHEYQFDLGDELEYLVIQAPMLETDSKHNFIRLRADTDIDLIYLRTSHSWRIQIVPNTLPPTPTNKVNVTVGDHEP